MIKLEIPGRGRFELKYLVLDVNGTLALDGKVLSDVSECLSDLDDNFDIHILTADTHGKQAEIDQQLGIVGTRISPHNEAEQKAEYIKKLGSENTVAIGNGANDRLMLKVSKIGIAIVGQEGAAISAIQNADIVCNDIRDALKLLSNPKRIAATLRS